MADILRAADTVKRAAAAPLTGDHAPTPVGDASRAAELALAGDDPIRTELSLVDLAVAAIYALAETRAA